MSRPALSRRRNSTCMALYVALPPFIDRNAPPLAVGFTQKKLIGLPAAIRRDIRAALFAMPFATAPAWPCEICVAVVVSFVAPSAVERIGTSFCPASPELPKFVLEGFTAR